MRLLVSVRNAREARAALAGGADIVDAKEPARGALGPVAPEVLSAIARAVSGARPLSAALGDAADEASVERAAREAAARGAAYVKLGFGGHGRPLRDALALATAAVRGAGAASGRVVLVAYGDAERADAVRPEAVVDVAARAGAVGVLLDTAFKDGYGLFRLWPLDRIAAWVAAAHDAALFAALAGGLSGGDVLTARALGADVVGVRGAACEGGRTGRLSRARVAALAALSGRARAGSAA